MRCAILAMHVEFLLQQSIHSRVQAEGKSRWATDPQTPIEIEASQTLLEELDLTPAQWKERLLSRSVELGDLGRASHGENAV
jgi:hypothetical protein